LKDGRSQKIRTEIERKAFISVPSVALGEFQQPPAYRKNVTRILRDPVPFMWNVKKG
jgi:hypothetical protein